jgi:hypothetical protein
MYLRKLAGAAALAIATLTGAVSTQAATIDLGFVLDGSGSVATNDFVTARTALSAALSQIPTSGANEYRIAVTTFGGTQRTIVAPTIVTAANLASIQADVAAAARPSSTGSTQTGPAITFITDLFLNAGGLGATTLINITTDGQASNQTAAENAALAAFNAGVDGISFEAVGSGVSSLAAQQRMARIAGLGTAGDPANGVIVTDLTAIPNAITTGFVIPVSSFAAYEAAINAKIGRIVDDTQPTPNVIPLPAGLPLLLAGLGAFAFMRRRAAA